jgi:hypothetical protein
VAPPPKGTGRYSSQTASFVVNVTSMMKCPKRWYECPDSDLLVHTFESVGQFIYEDTYGGMVHRADGVKGAK